MQNCKTQKNIRNGLGDYDAPVGSETLKKLVAIAATLLVVSAGTDVPLLDLLQGSGKLETEAICWRYAASTRLLSGWPRLAP